MVEHNRNKKTSKPIGSRNRKGLQNSVEIPVNLERVLLKAAEDPRLCKQLITDRDRALSQLGLDLRPSEKAMLCAIPPNTLQSLIERFKPQRLSRSRFAKQVVTAVAGSMLISAGGCSDDADAESSVIMGVTPEWSQDSSTWEDKGTGGTGGGPDWRQDSSIWRGEGGAGVGPDWPLDAGTNSDGDHDAINSPDDDAGQE